MHGVTATTRSRYSRVTVVGLDLPPPSSAPCAAAAGSTASTTPASRRAVASARTSASTTSASVSRAPWTLEVAARDRKPLLAADGSGHRVGDGEAGRVAGLGIEHQCLDVEPD